jgi:hypothetical protein
MGGGMSIRGFYQVFIYRIQELLYFTRIGTAVPAV